jgi:KDO2-lipid IV(A) lauroyltransferase
LKWVFFKLALLYPRVYAFFCYYRKKRRQEELEEKVKLFFSVRDPRRVKTIVKGIFELRGGRKMQRYLIPRIDHQFIEWFVTIEGLTYLDKALKEGRGILMMAGHIGNPHIGFSVLRAMGYQITIIKGGKSKKARYRKNRYTDPPEFTIFTEDAPLTRNARERALDVLRSGRPLYYSMDAFGGKRRIEVPFLGRNMAFATGTLHLARQTNAIVLPFIHLYRHGRIELIFKGPIDADWMHGEEDYRRMISEFTEWMESIILKYPEEYMGIYGDTVLDHYYREVKGTV